MAASAPTIPRRRKPWATTFFGLLAIGGLVAMPILAGAPDGARMPDWVRFVGHFHPLLLHLPIGVFALIVVQELGYIFGRERGNVRHPSLFPMFFGAVSAIVATLAGFLLYHGGEEYAGNELVERHMWAGLAFSVAAVVTFLVKAWTIPTGGNPAWYRLFLFSSVGVMGFASHDGGSITHGDDHLTKFAPDPLREVLGLEPKAKEKPKAAAEPLSQVVFADIVHPIFENRCVQCHKESKAKGKLRMDSYEMLVKGGKEGPAIEPGNAAESNILVRIHLPEDDEDHMPPEGKPQMLPEEIAVVTWWINAGADPAKTLAEHEVPPEISEAIAKVLPAAAAGKLAAPGESAAPAVPAGAPAAALVSSVDALSKEFPGALGFESQGSPWVTFTAASLRGSMDDEDFKKLEPVVPNLVSLDLSATRITDEAVAELAGSTHLRQIRLAETAVTDAAIDTLVKIPALESINLYGTKVTDAGIAKLAELPNLKRVYLWQTAVTAEAIQALEEKRPGLEIVTGVGS